MDRVDLQLEIDKHRAVQTVIRYFGNTDAIDCFGGRGWFELQFNYLFPLGTKKIKMVVLIHEDCFNFDGDKITRTGYFNLKFDCTPSGLQQVLNIETALMIISKGLNNDREMVFEYTYKRLGFNEKSPVILNLTYDYEDALEHFCADMMTNLRGSYMYIIITANASAGEDEDDEDDYDDYDEDDYDEDDYENYKEEAMQRYLNLNGNSNVESYRIGEDYIDVKFFGTFKIYRYSYMSAGIENVEAAKSLARQGCGLNSFIMRKMKYLYEKDI